MLLKSKCLNGVVFDTELGARVNKPLELSDG